MYIWRALFLFRAPPLQVIQLPTLDDSFSVSAFQPLNEKRPFSKHFKGFQRKKFYGRTDTRSANDVTM
jgi:hypothetical protein